MKRRALFVGVNKYDDPQIRDLRYSWEDAHTLFELFSGMGYEADYLSDPTKSEVMNTLHKLTCEMGAGDFFLFYFAGHGFTVSSGKHLLFCKDDTLDDLRDDDAGIAYGKLLRKTEKGGYGRAFVLDACRSDFLTGTRGTDTTTRDLKPIADWVQNVPGDFAVMRSCKQYEHAHEIDALRHGLFTLAFLNEVYERFQGGKQIKFGEDLCCAVTSRMRKIAMESKIHTPQTPEFAMCGNAPILLPGRDVKIGTGRNMSLKRRAMKRHEAVNQNKVISKDKVVKSNCNLPMAAEESNASAVNVDKQSFEALSASDTKELAGILELLAARFKECGIAKDVYEIIGWPCADVPSAIRGIKTISSVWNRERQRNGKMFEREYRKSWRVKVIKGRVHTPVARAIWTDLVLKDENATTHIC